MKKLGLRIENASNGRNELLTCNKDNWTKDVFDLRNGVGYLNQFDYKSYDDYVTFLLFKEDGWFVVVAKTIAGRGGDYMSAWIYIPNDINIEDGKIKSIYDIVVDIIQNGKMDSEYIKETFYQPYPEREKTTNEISSQSDKFAYIYYGNTGKSLGEILNAGYQNKYSKYKTIFLLEENGPISIKKVYEDKFDDLTKEKLESYCLVSFNLPSYIKLEIVDKFNSQVQTGDSKTIRLLAGQYTFIFSQEGYKPQKTTPIYVTGKEWVFDNKKIRKWERESRPITITIPIKVEGEDIKQITKDIDISVYENANHNILTQTIEVKNIRKQKAIKDANTQLNIWKERLIGLAAAIVLLAVMFGVIMLIDKLKGNGDAKSSTETNTGSIIENTSDDIKTSYLNDNKDAGWVKDSLNEKFRDALKEYDAKYFEKQYNNYSNCGLLQTIYTKINEADSEKLKSGDSAKYMSKYKDTIYYEKYIQYLENNKKGESKEVEKKPIENKDNNHNQNLSSEKKQTKKKNEGNSTKNTNNEDKRQ